jgi:TolA-binding protein
MNFHTTYSKTEEPNIFINVKKVSSLKRASYFYYNVLFECNYSGKTQGGGKFNVFDRVAEVVVVKDGKWRLYFRAIRFPSENGKDFDNSNDYTEIVATDTDVDRMIKAFNDEKENQLREEKKKIEKLIFEGDDAFEDKNYEKALSKYRDARLINLTNKEALEKTEKTRKAITAKKQKEKEEEDRKIHIEILKVTANKETTNFNFKLAKLYCDSLIKDFNVTDPSITKLNDRLASVISYLVGIESAMERKAYGDAKKKCEEIIITYLKKKPYPDSLGLAEFYYRFADMYITSDPGEIKRIFENLGNAIIYSNGRHQAALKDRAEMHFKNKQITDAFADAMHLIENDSRNPENYIFAADIYKQDSLQPSSIDKAIELYGKAIFYKTHIQGTFLTKAKLEYKKNLFAEVIKTTTQGIESNHCYGLLFYYRGLANYKIAEFLLAGNDFRNALKCGGLEETHKTEITKLSNLHIISAAALLTKESYTNASLEYSKSINIDSAQIALYGRAFAYLKAGGNDQKALTDLNALLHANFKYNNAHALRGFALSNLKQYDQAMKSFQNETNNFPKNPNAYYYKGHCEFLQEKFTDAITSFETSASIVPTDSAWHYSSQAAYNSNNYDKAIANSQKARKFDTKNFKVYLVCGKAYCQKGLFDRAVTEFEQAKKMIKFDDELFFYHALALEMTGEHKKASINYDLLIGTKIYSDTASLRSGICLIKEKDMDFYTNAISKITAYTNTNALKKAEANAYIAYAHLQLNAPDKAEAMMAKAQNEDAKHPMVLFTLACKSAYNNNDETALNFLDQAIELGNFTKKEIENEKLFKSLKKNSKYKEILTKHYK